MLAYVITASAGILVGAVAMYIFKPQIKEVVENVRETFEEVLDRLEEEKVDLEKDIAETWEALTKATGRARDNLEKTLEDLESDLEQVKDEIADIFEPAEQEDAEPKTPTGPSLGDGEDRQPGNRHDRFNGD